VDFLFSSADISDRAVTREELEAAIEAEEDPMHVHGPGCGHDHGDEKPKAKKAASKKADAEPKAEKPAKAAKAPKAEAEEKPAKKAPAKKAK
jgi:trigger factor